jgi:adenylate cyclase class 2
MENFEAELKFILKSPEKAIANLSTIATLAKKDEYQKDTYYIPAHRNFLDKNPVAEWLRVRETKDSTSINYKNRGTNNTCDEFETKVAKIDQLTHILARLDFKPIIVVEKSRTTWQYKKAEIAIDEVTDL